LEKAVALYAKAIEAQPGAKLNAQIANRIAQMYAFNEDSKRGLRPDYKKAAAWWTRCLELTDRSQNLWGFAQMGLACTGVALKNLKSSLSPIDEILKVDPDSIQLEDWCHSSYVAPEEWKRQQLAYLRQGYREFQKEVREKKQYLEKAMDARKRKRELPPSPPQAAADVDCPAGWHWSKGPLQRKSCATG
jgi:tetratricopeptide (TPR) repeat protein